MVEVSYGARKRVRISVRVTSGAAPITFTGAVEVTKPDGTVLPRRSFSGSVGTVPGETSVLISEAGTPVFIEFNQPGVWTLSVSATFTDALGSTITRSATGSVNVKSPTLEATIEIILE